MPTTWNCQISHFVKDVNARKWLSFSFPHLQCSLSEFNCRKICQHWQTERNGISAVRFEAAYSLFKWHFRCYIRLFCLSCLLMYDYFSWVFGDVMFCKVPAFLMLICILKEKVKLQVFKIASQNINPFPGWTACSHLCESKDNFVILLVKGGRGLWNHIRMSTILLQRQEKNGKNHEKLTLILFHYATALSSI